MPLQPSHYKVQSDQCKSLGADSDVIAFVDSGVAEDAGCTSKPRGTELHKM
jgi:hypothetical protein